jgi:hypothetical protein
MKNIFKYNVTLDIIDLTTFAIGSFYLLASTLGLTGVHYPLFALALAMVVSALWRPYSYYMAAVLFGLVGYTIWSLV